MVSTAEECHKNIKLSLYADVVSKKNETHSEWAVDLLPSFLPNLGYFRHLLQIRTRPPLLIGG
jgi:hypothetical protein